MAPEATEPLGTAAPEVKGIFVQANVDDKIHMWSITGDGTDRMPIWLRYDAPHPIGADYCDCITRTVPGIAEGLLLMQDMMIEVGIPKMAETA